MSLKAPWYSGGEYHAIPLFFSNSNKRVNLLFNGPHSKWRFISAYVPICVWCLDDVCICVWYVCVWIGMVGVLFVYDTVCMCVYLIYSYMHAFMELRGDIGCPAPLCSTL